LIGAFSAIPCDNNAAEAKNKTAVENGEEPTDSDKTN
jgi:hypothetical protein